MNRTGSDGHTMAARDGCGNHSTSRRPCSMSSPSRVRPGARSSLTNCRRVCGNPSLTVGALIGYTALHFYVAHPRNARFGLQRGLTARLAALYRSVLHLLCSRDSPPSTFLAENPGYHRLMTWMVLEGSDRDLIEGCLLYTSPSP